MDKISAQKEEVQRIMFKIGVDWGYKNLNSKKVFLEEDFQKAKKNNFVLPGVKFVEF